MKGMEQMLKMFGFDIEELKTQVGPKIEEMQAMAQRFEMKLDTVIENQNLLYHLLVAGKVIPTVDDFRQLKQLETAHVNGTVSRPS